MIHDTITKATLATIQPSEVVAYLRTKGWSEAATEPGRLSRWEKPSGENLPFEVVVPLDRGFRDYVDGIWRVVDTLRAAEDRSPNAVFRDLQSTTLDVLRIRLMAKESADGTLPLDQGAELVEHVRDLVMASACVTAKPRPWYRHRRPTEAEEYLRTVRLGQTEIGSYVVTVLTRVPPALKSDESLSAPISAPFERRVTTNLARALDATRDAAEKAVATGDLKPFREQYRSGITVNLCDAISGLAPEDPRSHDGLRFEFTWSALRPQKVAVPARISIPPDVVGVIAEAGRMLREFSPLDETEFVGSVRRLDRKADDDVGVATVVGYLEGQVRNVRVHLSAEEYATAIKAHEDRLPVMCIGDIVRDGRSLVMKGPESFAIHDDQNSPESI